MMIYTTNTCDECGANEDYWIYDSYRDELVCKRCGMVLKAPIHYNWLYGKIKDGKIKKLKIKIILK